MHMYHDANGQLPLGANNNPRQTWVMFLWSFMEQQNLGAPMNIYNQNFYTPPATIGGTLQGMCGAKVPQYYCPSDFGVDLDASDAYYQRRRGNYVVNWGAVKYDTPPPYNPTAPFAHLNGNRSTPLVVKIVNITDGTANTLMMSETLMAWSPEDDDWRGDIQNDDGVFKFMTITTPNSNAPDVVNWAIPNNDVLMPVTTAGAEYSAARSRHNTGVNVSMCDGSVRFVSNGISLGTWQALGTMNGGEVIGSDF